MRTRPSAAPPPSAPAINRCSQDAKAKQFEVLLVDDFSRLSRDSIETETARRRLVHWGVRLIGVSDGIDTQHEGHELLSGVQGHHEPELSTPNCANASSAA